MKKKEKVGKAFDECADKQNILELFMMDIKKVFDIYIDKYEDKIEIKDLTRSADLFVDTLNKEIENVKKK